MIPLRLLATSADAENVWSVLIQSLAGNESLNTRFVMSFSVSQYAEMDNESAVLCKFWCEKIITKPPRSELGVELS
jgi:hypothetical protein